MADSDDDSSGEDRGAYVFYKDRKDWADVLPVPQDDGPMPACPIAYSPKCKTRSSDSLFDFNSTVRDPMRLTGVCL